MTDKIVKHSEGHVVRCYGELREDSNFEVVCYDERDDDCWTDANPMNGNEPFESWEQVVEILQNYFESDIVEITAC